MIKISVLVCINDRKDQNRISGNFQAIKILYPLAQNEEGEEADNESEQ